SKSEVSLGVSRRVHRLHVRPSRAETIMHERLAAFTRSVQKEQPSPAAWLALSVLHKRALSSARSLQQSVERRLNEIRNGDIDLRQLVLPLPDPHGEFDKTDLAPAWLADGVLRDAGREQQLLGDVAAAAKHAAVAETKCAVIRRLLRRVREPVVI